MIEHAKNDHFRIRGRLLLLLPLAALLILGGILITHAPPGDASRGTSGSWLSGNKQYAVFFDEVHRNKPNRTEIDVTIIDLQTGEVESMDVPIGHTVDAFLDKDWNVYLLQRPLDATGAKLNRDSARVVFLDFSTRQVRIGREVGFPESKHSRLVGERYWVVVGEDQIHVFDTKNEAGGVKSIAAKTNLRFIREQQESNRFFLIHGNVTPAQPAQAPVSRPIELYEIDDSGTPRLITSWPAGLIDGWTEADNNEEHIYSFAPDLTKIEVRSARDGTLESSFSVPGVEEFDAGDSIYARILNVKKGQDQFEFFDLESRQWLPNPGPTYRFYDISSDRRYFYFSQTDGDDIRRVKVLDGKTGQFVSQFSMPRSGRAFRVDDRLVVTSQRYGYSVQFLDFATGKLIREIRPLAWIVNLLIALIVMYAFWSVAWMVVSVRERGWAWFDVMLVIGLPALLMILRTALRGETADLARPPTRYALASVVAAEMLAMTWIVFGKTRLSLRIVPLLVLIASHMVLLTVVFHEQPWIVWHATKCALIPAVCLMPVLGLLRLLGCRLRQEAPEQPSSEINQSFGRSKFALRDLILITVVAALLFAAARPVLDTISVFVFVNTNLFLPLGVAVVCGLAAMVLSLHRRRGLFVLATLLAVAGVAYLAWTPISLFATGRYSTRRLDPYLIDTSLAGGVALMVALIPYRLRGWTLTR